jgi:hypothetical protein
MCAGRSLHDGSTKIRSLPSVCVAYIHLVQVAVSAKLIKRSMSAHTDDVDEKSTELPAPVVPTVSAVIAETAERIKKKLSMTTQPKVVSTTVDESLLKDLKTLARHVVEIVYAHSGLGSFGSYSELASTHVCVLSALCTVHRSLSAQSLV